MGACVKTASTIQQGGTVSTASPIFSVTGGMTSATLKPVSVSVSFWHSLFHHIKLVKVFYFDLFHVCGMSFAIKTQTSVLKVLILK